jgi:hypothetical protein
MRVIPLVSARLRLSTSPAYASPDRWCRGAGGVAAENAHKVGRRDRDPVGQLAQPVEVGGPQVGRPGREIAIAAGEGPLEREVAAGRQLGADVAHALQQEAGQVVQLRVAELRRVAGVPKRLGGPAEAVAHPGIQARAVGAATGTDQVREVGVRQAPQGRELELDQRGLRG